MSAYYYYVNETKKSFFCIDPSNQDITRSFIGKNLGSRILSYLLLDNNCTFVNHPLVSSWIGDHFYITGDDYKPDFENILDTYENLNQTMLEMIVEINPCDLLYYGGYEWLLELAEQNNTPDEELERVIITSDMRKKILTAFGNQHNDYPTDELMLVIETMRSLFDTK